MTRSGGSSGSVTERGYLTTCGPADWQLAVDWALALRGHGVPVGAMIGDRVRAVATPAELDVFDHLVAEPPDAGRGYRAILSVAQASPYERTFFMQSDVRAFSPPNAVFDRLEGTGFALQGELLPPEHPALIYGLRIREMTARFPTPHYLKCQSGVIYFEKEAGRSILGGCKALATEFGQAFRGVRRRIAERLMTDEWLLGIVGGRRADEVGLIGYPVPMAWYNYGLTPTTRRTPLLHLNTLPAASLTAEWLLDVQRLRGEAGLDPLGSFEAWRRKLLESAASERGWVLERAPWSKLRRFRRWWRVVKQGLDAPGEPATLLELARHEEWERARGWADGEQRSYPRRVSSSDGAGRRLAEQAGVDWGGARVVDLGCGPAPTAAVSAGCREWFGVDPLVAAASEGAQARLRGVAESVPLPAGSADVVTAIAVLDQVSDLAAALREVDRLLVRGGFCVVVSRVEHYPDFGEAHSLRWSMLRDALPAWSWVREERLEMPDAGVRAALGEGRPFDFRDRACRAGVIVAVGRKG